MGEIYEAIYEMLMKSHTANRTAEKTAACRGSEGNDWECCQRPLEAADVMTVTVKR